MNDQKIPSVDIQFAKLVVWANKNLTKREQDLIYLFENFQKAYLTNKEIKSGFFKSSPLALKQKDRVFKIAKELNIEGLLEDE